MSGLPRVEAVSPLGRKLSWVIAGLALAVVPHVPHLSLWILVLLGAAVAARIVTELKGWALPPKWLRILIAFGALFGVLATYRTLDRKSTRLNSSHVRISYAVFCLKKKKK